MFVCGMKAGSSEEEEEDVMDILQVRWNNGIININKLLS